MSQLTTLKYILARVRGHAHARDADYFMPKGSLKCHRTDHVSHSNGTRTPTRTQLDRWRIPFKRNNKLLFEYLLTMYQHSRISRIVD